MLFCLLWWWWWVCVCLYCIVHVFSCGWEDVLCRALALKLVRLQPACGQVTPQAQPSHLSRPAPPRRRSGDCQLGCERGGVYAAPGALEGKRGDPGGAGQRPAHQPAGAAAGRWRRHGSARAATAAAPRAAASTCCAGVGSPHRRPATAALTAPLHPARAGHGVHAPCHRHPHQHHHRGRRRGSGWRPGWMWTAASSTTQYPSSTAWASSRAAPRSAAQRRPRGRGAALSLDGFPGWCGRPSSRASPASLTLILAVHDA